MYTDGLVLVNQKVLLQLQFLSCKHSSLCLHLDYLGMCGGGMDSGKEGKSNVGILGITNQGSLTHSED